MFVLFFSQEEFFLFCFAFLSLLFISSCSASIPVFWLLFLLFVCNVSWQIGEKVYLCRYQICAQIVLSRGSCSIMRQYNSWSTAVNVSRTLILTQKKKGAVVYK